MLIMETKIRHRQQGYIPHVTTETKSSATINSNFGPINQSINHSFISDT